MVTIAYYIVVGAAEREIMYLKSGRRSMTVSGSRGGKYDYYIITHTHIPGIWLYINLPGARTVVCVHMLASIGYITGRSWWFKHA